MLFNRYTEHYLKYKLSLVNKNHISSKYPILNFEEVLREHFPEIDIRPAIGNKSCWNCASLVECDVSQLRDIENSIREMLRWRNYDELIQMKKVFNEVSKKSQNPVLRLNRVRGQQLLQLL